MRKLSEIQLSVQAPFNVVSSRIITLTNGSYPEQIAKRLPRVSCGSIIYYTCRQIDRFLFNENCIKQFDIQFILNLNNRLKNLNNDIQSGKFL